MGVLTRLDTQSEGADRSKGSAQWVCSWRRRHAYGTGLRTLIHCFALRLRDKNFDTYWSRRTFKRKRVCADKVSFKNDRLERSEHHKRPTNYELATKTSLSADVDWHFVCMISTFRHAVLQCLCTCRLTQTWVAVRQRHSQLEAQRSETPIPFLKCFASTAKYCCLPILFLRFSVTAIAISIHNDCLRPHPRDPQPSQQRTHLRALGHRSFRDHGFRALDTHLSYTILLAHLHAAQISRRSLAIRTSQAEAIRT